MFPRVETHIDKLYCEQIVDQIYRAEPQFNGVARTLKKLIRQRDTIVSSNESTITSLFKTGTSLKETNLLQEGANSFL